MKKVIDPSKIPLKSQEQLFVDAYCGPANYNGKKAWELVFNEDPTYYNELSARVLLKKPNVQSAIKKHQEKLSKKMNITEIDVLNRLWEEANAYGQGTNHNARITALVWIGKHLGMWAEKPKQVEQQSVTYNIVNYSTVENPDNNQKLIEVKQEDVIEENDIPSNVSITSYN